MTQTSDLILREETTAIQIFSTEGGLDPVVQEAKDFVDSFEHDLSTGVGRKRTASLAAKVAKLKTTLDGMGKDLVSDWKTKAKKVDESRKAMRDELDDLKVIARKPLTDWEEEQARIEDEKAERLEAERISAEIEAGHEMALLMNEKIDRDRAEAFAEEERRRQAETERLAKEQAERDERIAQEAREKAERDAAQVVEQAHIDKLAAEKAAIAAEERSKINEQARLDSIRQAEENAKQAAIKAEEDAKKAVIDAQARAKRDAEEAVKREQDRVERERLATQQEQERRERNTKHKGKINRSAVEALIACSGITETQAKMIVKGIITNKIPAVSINY